MNKTVVIRKAFNGPPNCGQGGYVSGILAGEVDSAICETSLKLPTPLDKPLIISTDGEATSLLSNDKVVVSAQSATLDLDIPACPSGDKTAAARENYRGLGETAVFTSCFVCGKDRHDHAAMRIFSGLVEGAEAAGLHAAQWTPHSVHCDEEGNVAPEFLWSALDCPGYFAGCKDGQLALLGRMTTSITGKLRVDEPSTVISWPITTSGRKAVTGTAIYNVDKKCIASAEGLWIHVDKNPFAI